MARSSTKFERTIDLLADYYGTQEQHPSADPLELILWENVGYLISDERRGQAFGSLRQKIGTRAEAILSAKPDDLYNVAKLGGMLPEVRVERLQNIARITLDEFGGHLDKVVKRPLAEAKKAMKLFPSIGDPGAEKILLLSRSHPVMAFESNGLRALIRLGFGREQKNYSATYRSVQTAISGQYKPDFDRLIQAHLLLRKHGQELCRRSKPICQPCPLKKMCSYYGGSVD